MVSAPGRRRRWLFDGEETLAAYIASASDLDDLVPTIVAYQLEWTKMHRLLRSDRELVAALRATTPDAPPDAETMEKIRARLLIQPNDWVRLMGAWGDRAVDNAVLHLRQKLAPELGERCIITIRQVGYVFIGFPNV